MYYIIDVYVQAVDELESNNASRSETTTHSTMPALATRITSYRPGSLQRRPATFVVLAPNSSRKQKNKEENKN